VCFDPVPSLGAIEPDALDKRDGAVAAPPGEPSKK
jgi:hypothetical protein